MILLKLAPITSIAQAQAMLETAINVEFGTLPPYLYAQLTILPGSNGPALARLQSITHQEMIHLCLAANILNALGGSPKLSPPTYPGPLPGDIGHDGKVLTLHILPFGKPAMQQGMNIEMPVDPIDFPQLKTLAAAPLVKAVTIGQFYEALDAYLKTLPATAWQAGRNQIADKQFFPGQLFAVNNYADAHKAIQVIISEGEGTSTDPLDFGKELAHFYRFEEIYRNQVLTSSDSPQGFSWGGPLGVDYDKVFPAIADPQLHDFSKEPPAAREAQAACTIAYSAMVDSLNLALNGNTAQLGIAVRKMFDLRMAAIQALHAPLTDKHKVAGPAFIYKKI
ncbi:ferritin-like domain-containing protein [Undibacterium sp. Di27W]|uniref:ferritin-like domain-containing protein n=1 Tax=Undibacterium sp. Di27W TaxID=3413036 RepID=UPI003BF42D46